VELVERDDEGVVEGILRLFVATKEPDEAREEAGCMALVERRMCRAITGTSTKDERLVGSRVDRVPVIGFAVGSLEGLYVRVHAN
jgi:hypothetical protein